MRCTEAGNGHDGGRNAPRTVDRGGGASGLALRRGAAKVQRGLVMLAPGLILLLFWQWASGRLIAAIYVSRPTDIAARLYEMFASGEILPHLLVTAQELVLG